MIHNRFEFRASLCLLRVCFLIRLDCRYTTRLREFFFFVFYELVTKRKKKTSKTITCENVKENKKSVHSFEFILFTSTIICGRQNAHIEREREKWRLVNGILV